MHPLIEIAALHLGLAALWIPPARRLLPEVHPAGAASLGYVLGAAVLMLLHHVLNFFDVHSDPAAWCGCALAWAMIMRKTRPVPRLAGPGFRRDCLGIVVLTAFGLGLRLVDALRHDSLACADSYVFLQLVYKFVQLGHLFHSYIAGIPALLGTLSVQATPVEMLRFGPALLSGLGIPAFFALGCALGGRKAGWISAIGLAGVFGLLHIVSFNLVFVQFATLSLVLPWFLILLPLSLGAWRARHDLLLAGVLYFLVLTGTYFALILVGAAGLWMVGQWALRSLAWPVLLRGLLILSIVPAWIGFHYEVALPLKFPSTGGNFGSQVSEFEKLEQKTPAAAAERKSSAAAEARSPVIRGLLLFAKPKRFELLRSSMAESLLLWSLFLLGISRLRTGPSVSGFAGFLIVFSMLGTVTGVFEMPAYQGRYLYVIVLLGLPVAAGLWMGRIAPACLRRSAVRHSPFRALFRWKVLLRCACLACIPSILYPPVTGRTIPTDPVILTRRAPEDDLLTRVAICRPGEQPLQMVFLFRSKEDFYPGSAVSRLNVRVPVVDAEIRRIFVDKLPPERPYAAPNQPVMLIMHREVWDDAPAETKALLRHDDPARILLMTPGTVVVDTGRVPVPPGVSKILRAP